MASCIALLRGVNVGGRKMVAMADLCRLLADVGLDGPRSLLQSGNLLFRGNARSGATLERLLEAEAAKRLGLHTEFFVRTAAEWGAIVASNPFPDQAKRDPARLHVMCFKTAPAAADVKRLEAAIPGRERLQVTGRDGYIVYPDGAGRSKLTSALIDRTLATRGTGRNWNTVLKLAAAVATQSA